MRSVFRTIGTGAPNKSQEVAWLELSGGVRSLPQVPWWNAERRAAPSCVLPRMRGRMKVGAAPCREARRLRNNVFRRSAFLSSLRGAFARKQSKLCAAAPGLLCRFAPRNDEIYPRMIVTPPVPPPEASDEDHAWPSFVCLVVGMARARRRVARTTLLIRPRAVKRSGGGGPRVCAVEGACSGSENYEPRKMRRSRCPLHHRCCARRSPSPAQVRGGGKRSVTPRDQSARRRCRRRFPPPMPCRRLRP